MIRLLTAYLITGVAFALIDSVWLKTMLPRLYQPEIGGMLAPQLRIGPAIAFYLLYILGIMWFAVAPALAQGRWQSALLNGAAFGFFAYMTYDLTNYATLRDWSLKITLADMVWGTVLTGSAATLGMIGTRMLFGK